MHTAPKLAPESCALVVIDMQNAFLDPGIEFRHAPAALDIVEPINALARWFRDIGSRVIWVQTTSRADPEDWPSLRQLIGDEAMQHRASVLAPGSPGHALWSGMHALPEDAVVLKYRYSGMAEPDGELETLLRGTKVQRLFFVGTQTNICCESTARDAMMRGFEAFLVHDCLAAETPEAHKASISHFPAAFGGCPSAADVRTLIAGDR